MSTAPTDPTVELADQQAWEDWLAEHHGTSTGVWLKIAKKSSPRTTVDHPQALEIALCYGWIDAQRRPLDADYYLQRFTPRRPRSKWSQINREKANELIAQNRMKPAGLTQVQAAKQDGRWDAAYEPQSRASVPEDFQQALDENPAAKEFFATLTGINRYAFLYRISDAKRPETRAKRIAQYVQMLATRQTLH